MRRSEAFQMKFSVEIVHVHIRVCRFMDRGLSENLVRKLFIR